MCEQDYAEMMEKTRMMGKTMSKTMSEIIEVGDVLDKTFDKISGLYKYGGGPWAARSISDYPYPIIPPETTNTGLFLSEPPCKLELSGSGNNNTIITLLSKLFLNNVI